MAGIKKKGITLVELAAHCGLSKTAVGAILNRDPKYKVTDETREMVLLAARKFNYKPNPAARALITKKHFTVGMLFYSIKDRCYSEIMATAQREMAARSYASLFAFWEHSDLREAYNVLADHGVDGIITNTPEDMLKALPSDVPFVLYGCKSDQHDAVLVDRGTAIRKVLNHLYDQGHRKFGYLCNHDPEPRYKAFLDFLAEKELPMRSEWITPTENTIESREAATQQILACRERPTAIIAQNDVTAMAAMAMASAAGVKIPEEMSFVGFDNILESRYAVPALTTLDIKIGESAFYLVDFLLRRIANPEQPQMTHWIEPELVLRNSCTKAPI